MTTPDPPATSSTIDGEYALLLQAPSKPARLVSSFLSMLLTYRYGLDIIAADSFSSAYTQTKQHGKQIRCTFIAVPKKIDSKSSIASLSLDGEIMLFIIQPQHLIEGQKMLLHRMKNVYFCPWENAIKSGANSLHEQVTQIFAKSDIGDLYHAVNELPYDQAIPRIENRLKHLKTLPTLPEVALKIMELVKDPQTSAETLNSVVTSDPAIVHKLLQLVNSPLFAGSGHKGGWTLQEALVRLGRQKVGAIAQQVKLMTHLVKPESSQFDIERFWTHSLACAFIANRLVQNKNIAALKALPFNDYWISSLLHDIGKLALGFFFWSHFEAVLVEMGKKQSTFREAEKELGDVANHEYLGKLLLLKSRVGPLLIEAISAHDTPTKAPVPLACLVHLANNLSKELGLGYLPEEKTDYNSTMLKVLALDKKKLRAIRSDLRHNAAEEIKDLVQRCIH